MTSTFGIVAVYFVLLLLFLHVSFLHELDHEGRLVDDRLQPQGHRWLRGGRGVALSLKNRAACRCHRAISNRKGHRCHRRQRGTPLLEQQLLGASGDLQLDGWKKAAEVTGLGTAERSCGQNVVANPRRAMVQAWMQRRTNGSRNAMCQKRPAMTRGTETRTLSHEGWAQTWKMRK